jgi:glyoxylase I family protein
MQTTILAALCCLAAFAVQASSHPQEAPARVAVRYQVKDVARSVEFYTKSLGFKVGQPQSPAFAQVSSGSLDVWLSGPGSSGSRVMPDGRKQEPGGWNRFVIQVTDLSARVEALKKQGVKFRNAIETGPGGSQIQIEDPDGNPIELFQPASR